MVRTVSDMISDPVSYEDTCEKHGPYTGTITNFFRREIRSGCPACAEIAKADREEQERRQEIEQREQWARERMEAKLGRAGIPARFQGKRFDDFIAETERQKKALAVCRSYAEQFQSNYEEGRCLMMMGRPGCGKTHMGAAIAHYVCTETKHSSVYRTLPGLVSDIRATYGEGSETTESQIISAVTTCGLLVLDEIGATKTSEFELSLIFNLINSRYEEKLPTIIISNLPPAELKAAIGDRCVDRLREGGGIVLGFDWESKRGSL